MVATWSGSQGHNQRMRILNLLFDPRYGGPQKRVIDVARRLAERGVDTVMCLPAGEGNAAEIAEAAGVRVRRLGMERIPNPRDLRRVMRWAVLFPRDVLRFVRLYREERPDAVHVNGAFFLPPALAARLVGVPLVWHLNDTLVPARAARMLGAIVRSLAARVVVAAEAVAVHYGVAGEPHVVVYAPVDVTRFAGRARVAPADSWRVGVVANWNSLKGQQYFVEACARVREELGDGFRAVMAGAKLPTHAAYAREVEERIDRLGLRQAMEDRGFVSDATEIIASLDVAVLSSIAEACPMVVLEAMAAGVPVVATDVGGVRELLLDEEGDAGIVVPARDPAALAEAILRLLRDPGLRAELGRHGRARAERLFSLDRCAERHFEVYSSVTRGARSARPATERLSPDPTALPRA